GSSELTRTGDIVGTLRYLAPERFRGQFDARSDVYSLGLTLYEMLTLQPAFAETQQDVLIQQVVRAEPARPRQLDRRIPRDLETIVLKAIAKEPARRYPTAVGLAEDLRRFVDDKPIQARRATQAEQLWRWSRRNPWLAGMGAAVLLLLVVVAVGATVAAVRIAGARDKANQSAFQSKQAEKKAEDEAEQNRQRLVRMLVTNGTRLMDEGDLLAALPWFVEALKRDPQREEMHRIRLGTVLRQAPKPVQMWFPEGGALAELSHDGRYVVALGGESARVWNASTGEPVTPPLQHNRTVWTASFSPDGRYVLTGCGDEKDGTARVWDAATGKPITAPLAHEAAVRYTAFSPDGRRVVTASGLNRCG